jgi:predicted secreted protein
LKRILFVSHCLLNTASKVASKKPSLEKEEELRRKFLRKALDLGVQFVQVPCPEFSAYGACRWGHVYEQFDTPFYRAHCRRLLEPYILELEEYLAHPRRFEILGFVGIDGSPSCGVRYTCRGEWGGQLSRRDDLGEVITSVHRAAGQGVFIEELNGLVAEKGITIRLEGLFALEESRVMALLDL